MAPPRVPGYTIRMAAKMTRTTPGSILLKGLAAVALVALVFVGVSLLFDLIRAAISAAVFCVVVYLGWRAWGALSK